MSENCPKVHTAPESWLNRTTPMNIGVELKIPGLSPLIQVITTKYYNIGSLDKFKFGTLDSKLGSRHKYCFSILLTNTFCRLFALFLFLSILMSAFTKEFKTKQKTSFEKKKILFCAKYKNSEPNWFIFGTLNLDFSGNVFKLFSIFLNGTMNGIQVSLLL